MDTWDRTFRNGNLVWGERPSDLALVALDYLRGGAPDHRPLRVLDIGCGYGRDAIYLHRSLGAHVVGIDTSSEAVTVARRRVADEGIEGVAFEVCSFADLADGDYRAILVSNLYHLLRPNEREALVCSVRRSLAPGGWLFLNALSTSDPEEYGQGKPVPDDPHSFVAGRYRHFSTRDELERRVCAMAVETLYEHAYDEPHADGPTHNHIAWILIARRLAD